MLELATLRARSAVVAANVIDLSTISGDTVFDLESITRQDMHPVVIVVTNDKFLAKYHVRFGYTLLNYLEMLADQDYFIKFTTNINMSGNVRKLVASKAGCWIDVGGRDDLAFASDGLFRSINVEVPDLPIYNNRILYADIVEQAFEEQASSLGQVKLYVWIWLCLQAAFGGGILYIGGSPGQNINNPDIRKMCASRVMIVDPREPDNNLDWCIFRKAYVTRGNFLKYFNEAKELFGELIVIFDIRRDKEDVGLENWEKEKINDTLNMQYMADLAIDNGAILASIKFWLPDKGIFRFPNVPIMSIPYGGQVSHELRTFQTMKCDPINFELKNLYNFAVVSNYNRYKNLSSYNFKKEFWPIGCLKQDVSKEFIMPRIVFSSPDNNVAREPHYDNSYVMPFVLNHISSLTSLIETVNRLSPEFFTLISNFDFQNQTLGLDHSQFYTEKVYFHIFDNYRTISYAEFCSVYGITSDVYFNIESQKVAFFVKRHKPMLYQVFRDTQTHLIRWVNHRFNALLLPHHLNVHKLRSKYIYETFNIVTDTGKAEVEVDGHKFICDPSGHLLGMLIAASFMWVDILDYLSTLGKNIRVSLANEPYNKREAFYEGRVITKLWHNYYDYLIALLIYKDSYHYGVPTQDTLVDYTMSFIRNMSESFEAFNHTTGIHA